MRSCALFPLTPALSLWERGNRIQPRDESKPFDFSQTRPVWLPLPKGEGWGEGEGTVNLHSVGGSMLQSNASVS
jgi:hypothetical protein